MAVTQKTTHEQQDGPPASTTAQQPETLGTTPEAPSFEKTTPPKRAGYTVSVSRTMLFALAMIIGLGLSFTAGVLYQKNNTASTASNFRAGAASSNESYGAGMGMGGRYGARMGGAGTVTAVSSSSITITLRSFGPDSSSSGTSKTYTIDDSTKIIVDGNTGSVNDIKTGDTVFVRTSSSSSTTATQIVVGNMPTPNADTQTDTSGTSTDTTDTSTI